MSKKFVFFYNMKNEPEKIGSVVPQHAGYWKDLDLPGYTGGPFVDRSGGLIAFQAENLDEATNYAENDPFTLNDLLACKCIKEWAA